MFGMLLGTLQKFQKDNSQDTEQVKKFNNEKVTIFTVQCRKDVA